MAYDFTDYEKQMDVDTAARFLDPNTRSLVCHSSGYRYGGPGQAVSIAQAVAAKYIYRMQKEVPRLEKEREMLWKTVDKLRAEREIEVIPVPVIKRAIAGINAADQCDQAGRYDYELRRALKTVLEWYNAPVYRTELAVSKRDGWIPKD